MSPIEILTAFVEGRLGPDKFEEHLYQDADLEAFLAGQTDLPPYARGVANSYDYLMSKRLSQPADLLNATSFAEGILSKLNVAFHKNSATQETFTILLRAQPAWLDLRGDYLALLLKEGGDRRGRELEAWLKSEIQKRFVAIKKPPKWLQAADWPIVGGEPAIFVGQLDVSELHHDTSNVYVFFSKKEGAYLTIKQSA